VCPPLSWITIHGNGQFAQFADYCQFQEDNDHDENNFDRD